MQTDELIRLLTVEAGPVRFRRPWRPLVCAMMLGFCASFATAVGLIGLLPAAAFLSMAPYVKWALGAAVLAGGLPRTAQLSRPDLHPPPWPVAVLAVLALGLILSLIWLSTLPEDLRTDALLGQTFWLCPVMILMLSLPTLLGIFWVLRRQAPTHLVEAGAAAGTVSAGISILAYATVCPETSPLFTIVWYSVGVLLTALLGAKLGPRWLGW